MRYSPLLLLLILLSVLSFSNADIGGNCSDLAVNDCTEETCNPDSPEYSPETCSEYQPNLWQRILEDIAGGVGTAAVLGLAAFLGALLIPPVRKYLSSLFSKLLGRNKIEAINRHSSDGVGSLKTPCGAVARESPH